MNWLVLFIAAGIGAVVVGMVGFGSSLVILPALLITYPSMFEPELAVRLAVGTTMATMAVGALSAGIAQARQKMVEWPLLKLMVLPYLIGALSGPWISQYLPVTFITVYIVTLLIVIGIRILWSQQASSSDTARDWRNSKREIAVVHCIISLMGSVAGVASGLFAIPYLTRFSLPLRRIIATSTVAAALYSLFATVGYVSAGWQASLPLHCLGYVHFPSFALMSVAGAICGVIGVKLGRITSVTVLKRMLGFFLLAAAVVVLVRSMSA